MNRNYIRPEQWGDNYDPPSPPHTEPHQRASWGLIAVALLFAFCAWLFAPSAHAQTACAWNADCLKWDRPTTYVDGTTLASTDVASYEIEAALLGSTAWTKVGTVSAPIQAFTRIGIKANEIWQYRVTVVLVSGQRSTPSNVAAGPPTVEPAPNPPTLKTVDTLAYEINKSTDALALNAVGTVALGVSCKPEYDANGLHVVPRSSVKFATLTKPLVVVAKCG
jgi:hypothetical protein